MEFSRLGRLRKKEFTRQLVGETRLSVKDFIAPLFVQEGISKKEKISSLPGVYRYSPDNLLEEVEELNQRGILAVLLFGLPEKKDIRGSPAYQPDGPVQQALRKIKKEFPELVLITDVCLCSYTSSGHCGIVRKGADGQVVIDEKRTREALSKIALAQAEAGADIVAPSSMLDGQVQTIRKTLDEHGLTGTAIMGYSAKYASSFYGPFREAAGCSPRFGDRKSYQMDYHNLKEALAEVQADIKEGADLVMVKPALAYLDVIRAVKENFKRPLVAYNVSGEYSMVKAAARQGWLAEKEAGLEILTALKRAGADLIITYWAKEAAQWLKE